MFLDFMNFSHLSLQIGIPSLETEHGRWVPWHNVKLCASVLEKLCHFRCPTVRCPTKFALNPFGFVTSTIPSLHFSAPISKFGHGDSILGSNPKLNRRVEQSHQFALDCSVCNRDEQPVWGVIMREIWPIFSANIRHLGVCNGILFDKLRRLTSPSILTDLDQLNSIYSGDLLPEAIGDDDFDGPNATISAGQMLSKWLHSPRKDGMPKQLHFFLKEPPNMEWANTLKKHFLRANAISSVSYQIQFTVQQPSTQIVPFELANEQTKEKLTLIKASANVWEDRWVMKRCQYWETAAVQWAAQNLDGFSTVEFIITSKLALGLCRHVANGVQLFESDLMHLGNGRSF